MRDDWSKQLADRWGLAWCKEDVDLHRQVAPCQPLRRLYRRLCHDPDVLFFPPDFGPMVFIYLMFYVVFSQPSLSLGDWLVFLVFGPGASAVIGLFLDFFFWPILLVLHKILEGGCWILDTIIFNNLILKGKVRK